MIEAGEPIFDEPSAAISVGEPTAVSKASAARWLQIAAFWSLFVAIAISALLAGLQLRHWIWIQTDPIRYTKDVDNAFVQGSETLREGYLNRYDNQLHSHAQDDNLDFDYGPARLLIATRWARHVRNIVDGTDPQSIFVLPWNQGFYETARQLGQTYELARPLLILNSCAEIIAAVGIYFLTRHWTIARARMISRWPSEKAAVSGLISALFFWFNLEVLCNAHAWPQWDVWLLPFYVWALFAASNDFFFIAGALIAAGAMFKGQILFGVPFLLAWPLFQGRILSAARCAAGLCVGFAACTGCWLVRANDAVSPQAVSWAASIAIAFLATSFAVRWRGRWYLRVAAAIVSSVCIFWPLRSAAAEHSVFLLLALALAIAAYTCFSSTKALFYGAITSVAVALFLCVPIFHGSMAWFQVGILFGTRHFLMMTSGPCNNLAALLNMVWHWEPLQPVLTLPSSGLSNVLGTVFLSVDRKFVFHAGGPFQLPMRYLLNCVYLTGLLICAASAARHAKTKNPRFLVCVAAMWLFFFAVMPQMHQRYLIWGAAFGSMTVALGPGYALLNVFITLVGLSQELLTMMRGRGFDNTLVHRIATGWHPGVAWAVLLAAAILLYLSVTGVSLMRMIRQTPVAEAIAVES